MVNNLDPLTEQFQAPIPGQSLTTEPGARPWEKPARFVEPEEAMSYYLDRFSSNPERTGEMLSILEAGFPVKNLVDGMTMAGVMEGLHSIDLAIILSPALFAFITSIADSANIEYKTGLTPNRDQQPVDNTLLARAKEETDPQAEELVKQVQEDENDRVKQALSGLMARENDVLEEEQ